MSGFYREGEIKDRPGIYKRITNIGTDDPVGAREGVGAAVVSGTWGPMREAHIVNTADDYAQYIGSGTGYDTIKEMFAGGVQTAVIVRVGKGGTKASVTLKGETDTKEVLKLTAKYPGTRELSITIRSSLENDKQREAIIYEGTRELEAFTFDKAENDGQGLSDLLKKKSKYVDCEVLDGEAALDDVVQKVLTGGTDPIAEMEDYAAGFEAASTEIFDSMCVDTNDTEVHAVLAAFIQRVYEGGEYPMATVSEPKSVDLEERMAHAKAFNDEKIHYVLNGWTDAAGNVHEGYLAAARLAGMIAAVPSNESLTHREITGAVSLLEPLTNAQIINALRSGCIVISKSKADQIIVEKGINTLVSPPADKDKGWQKIRRTKTRFELMDRIDRTLEPFVGQVNNDEDGRAAIIAAGQSVLDAMVGEGKILTGGKFALDESNPPVGDSAWFIIQVDDIDSFEIGYLTFQFRFSPES